MCGIVGFLAKHPQKSLLSDMLRIQGHRGPDDFGIFVDEDSGIHLGHNRLSIQDLSSHGHQPFQSDCGNYTIVFNGEIYNFKTIKKQLESLGYRFISESDTEVILYAYAHWGIECLKHFIGMFAFALFDKIRQKVLLVRDRSGIKPLYYYTGDTFLFSSELKSFHVHPDFDKTINKSILPYYFQFGYIPAPFSIYTQCHKLNPGHYLEYDLTTESYTLHKYWDVIDFYTMDKNPKSEAEILGDIENILLEACQLRMISDVPVGVFLSGGYDSSIVTALLQKNSTEKINTFTIGFNDKEYDEATHAKTIANFLGTNHTEYYCSENDLLNLLQEIPFYWDEPFADSSALPTMLVSKLAADKVKVVLSADGGDEVFCGYSKYFALKALNKINQSKSNRFILQILTKIFSSSHIEFFNKLLPKSKKQTNISEKFVKFKQALKTKDLMEMFINASSHVDPSLLDDIMISGRFKDFSQTSFETFKTIQDLEDLDQMMAIDYKTFLADDVLCKVDRATMSMSIEGREPLLDHRIIEYLSRVSVDLKYKNREGKYLLRQILYKYIPKELVDKPKSGFTIPLKKWLLNDLREQALKSLESDLLRDDKLFYPDKLEKITQDFKNGVIENPPLIWMIMMYVMWREQWQ